MCLAVPIKLTEIIEPADNIIGPIGKADLNGTITEVSLLYTPQAKVGDYILVHAGQALEIVTEEDAREIWDYLSQITEGLDEDITPAN